MPTLDARRLYADGAILYQAELDAVVDDIETLLNTTKLNDDNIQDGGITASTKLVDASISTGKLASQVVTTAKIADANVTKAKLDTTFAGAGLSFSTEALTVNVDSSTIEINTDTLRVKDSGIVTAKINDLAVTTGKLNDLAVTAGKIAAGAVTDDKLGTKQQVVCSSSGVFFGSSTSLATINNQETGSLTTNGRPVRFTVEPVQSSSALGFIYQDAGFTTLALQVDTGSGYNQVANWKLDGTNKKGFPNLSFTMRSGTGTSLIAKLLYKVDDIANIFYMNECTLGAETL